MLYIDTETITPQDLKKLIDRIKDLGVTTPQNYTIDVLKIWLNGYESGIAKATGALMDMGIYLEIQAQKKEEEENASCD